jgi:hypothetical protein
MLGEEIFNELTTMDFGIIDDHGNQLIFVMIYDELQKRQKVLLFTERRCLVDNFSHHNVQRTKQRHAGVMSI